MSLFWARWVISSGTVVKAGGTIFHRAIQFQLRCQLKNFLRHIVLLPFSKFFFPNVKQMTQIPDDPGRVLCPSQFQPSHRLLPHCRSYMITSVRYCISLLPCCVFFYFPLWLLLRNKYKIQIQKSKYAKQVG